MGVVKDAQVNSAIEPLAPVVYLAFWQDEMLVDTRMCVRTDCW